MLIEGDWATCYNCCVFNKIESRALLASDGYTVVGWIWWYLYYTAWLETGWGKWWGSLCGRVVIGFNSTP